MFLLIMPIVYANEIKVLYFFGSSCEFSKIEEANINKVKSCWEGKVSWLDYDLDSKSHIDMTIKYKILGVPTVVVECMNKTIKIDRKDSYFSQEINQTIYECQLGEVEQVKTNTIVVVLAFIFCLTAIYLAKRQSKRHLKKKRKAR